MNLKRFLSFFSSSRRNTIRILPNVVAVIVAVALSFVVRRCLVIEWILHVVVVVLVWIATPDELHV